MHTEGRRERPHRARPIPVGGRARWMIAAAILLIVVPSLAWPSKLAYGNALNPGDLEINDF